MFVRNVCLLLSAYIHGDVLLISRNGINPGANLLECCFVAHMGCADRVGGVLDGEVGVFGYVCDRSHNRTGYPGRSTITAAGQRFCYSAVTIKSRKT